MSPGLSPSPARLRRSRPARVLKPGLLVMFAAGTETFLEPGYEIPSQETVTRRGSRSQPAGYGPPPPPGTPAGQAWQLALAGRPLVP